jgi:hypothetical protein
MMQLEIRLPGWLRASPAPWIDDEEHAAVNGRPTEPLPGVLRVSDCGDAARRRANANPGWVRQRGQVIGLAGSRDKTLTFTTLRRLDRTCVVTLPYPGTVDEALYRGLRTHEERRCHGEEASRRTSAVNSRSNRPTSP